MSDKDTILSGPYCPCRICEAIFREERMTARYCSNPQCEEAFCKEHGAFGYGGRALCVVCAYQRYKAQATRAPKADIKECLGLDTLRMKLERLGMPPIDPPKKIDAAAATQLGVLDEIEEAEIAADIEANS